MPGADPLRGQELVDKWSKRLDEIGEILQGTEDEAAFAIWRETAMTFITPVAYMSGPRGSRLMTIAISMLTLAIADGLELLGSIPKKVSPDDQGTPPTL